MYTQIAIAIVVDAQYLEHRVLQIDKIKHPGEEGRITDPAALCGYYAKSHPASRFVPRLYDCLEPAYGPQTSQHYGKFMSGINLR